MNDFKIILLSKGKVAIIDYDDYEKVSKYKWCFSGKYAVRVKQGKTILMHRFIMSTPKGFDTDHINDNGLDNRKSNLRICSHSQNLMNHKLNQNNTSGYKNISWDKQLNHWRVSIWVNNKRVINKLFKDINNAISFRDVELFNLHGQFTRR
mgnify:CR=1 FL=1